MPPLGLPLHPPKSDEKHAQKSVQLVRGSSFRNDLLQNPYFSFIHGANAIDGISQICVESGQERGTEHDQKGDFVVESKYIVVDIN